MIVLLKHQRGFSPHALFFWLALTLDREIAKWYIIHRIIHEVRSKLTASWTVCTAQIIKSAINCCRMCSIRVLPTADTWQEMRVHNNDATWRNRLRSWSEWCTEIEYSSLAIFLCWMEVTPPQSSHCVKSWTCLLKCTSLLHGHGYNSFYNEHPTKLSIILSACMREHSTYY